MLDLNNMPPVALPEEVAELCRVDAATVRRWVRKGKLEALDTGRGGALRITGESVLRLFGRARQQSHLAAWHVGRTAPGVEIAPGQEDNARRGRLGDFALAGGGETK